MATPNEFTQVFDDKSKRYRDTLERIQKQRAQSDRRHENNEMFEEIRKQLYSGSVKSNEKNAKESSKSPFAIGSPNSPLNVVIVGDKTSRMQIPLDAVNPMADLNIATETTLQMLGDKLDSLNALTAMNDNKSKKVEETWKKDLTGVKGLAQKWNDTVGKILPGLKFDSLKDKFDPLIELSKTQAGYLKAISTNFVQWFKSSNTDKLRSSASVMSDLNVKEEKPNEFKNFLDLTMDEGMMKKMVAQIAGIATFFGAAGSLLSSGVGALLGKLAPNLPMIGGILARIATFFAGAGTFASILGGALLFSPIYAAFKNPEQLAGYISAFGTIFSENVVPAFKWIATEILPALSVAFAGLVVAADYLLDTVGSAINSVLIPILKVAVPAILKGIGKGIDLVWQYLKQITFRIFGIFGVGPYGKDGFFSNLFGIIKELPKLIFNMMDTFYTMIVNAFALDELLGMQKGETVFQRIQRFFVDELVPAVSNIFTYIIDSVSTFIKDTKNAIFGFIGNWYNKTVGFYSDLYERFMPDFIKNKIDDIISYVNNLEFVQKMKDKISSMFDYIVDMIPTWDDIKGWMYSMKPEWMPGDTFNKWFGTGEIDNQSSGVLNPNDTNTDSNKANLKPQNITTPDILKPASGAELRSSILNGNITIYQDNSTKSQSSTQNNVGGASRLGVPSTKPSISTWEQGVYNSGL